MHAAMTACHWTGHSPGPLMNDQTAKARRKPAAMEPRRKRSIRVRVERPRRARKRSVPRPRVMSSPAWPYRLLHTVRAPARFVEDRVKGKTRRRMHTGEAKAAARARVCRVAAVLSG